MVQIICCHFSSWAGLHIRYVSFSPTLSLLPSIPLPIVDSTKISQVHRRTVCVTLCQYGSVKKACLRLGEGGKKGGCFAVPPLCVNSFRNLAGTLKKRTERARRFFWYVACRRLRYQNKFEVSMTLRRKTRSCCFWKNNTDLEMRRAHSSTTTKGAKTNCLF